MKNRFVIFAKLLLTIAIIVFIFVKMNINIRDFSGVIKEKSPLLLCLVLSLIVNPYIVGNRWRSFLKMEGVVEPTWSLVKITLVSTFLGIAIPGSQGYDLLRIYQIEKKHPEKRGVVGSTVLVERILGLVILIIVALMSWLYVGSVDFFIPLFLLVSIVAILLVAIFNSRFYSGIQKLLQMPSKMVPVFQYISKLYYGLHTFPFSNKVVYSTFLIFCLQLSNILIISLLFDVCGYHIDLINHLCYIPLINVMMMIPITLGGFGIREGGYLLFYSQFDLPNTVIISVSLLSYIVILIIPALFGGVLFFIDSIRK